MSKEEYTVYIHTNKLNNKVYIGITKQIPERRWGKNGINYKSTPYFYSAIKKYGWDNFEHEILFTGLTKEEACEQECRLIKEFKSNDREFGYNITDGGNAPSMPESIRKQLSQRLKGNKNCLGRVLSEEVRRKIGDAQRGRKFTIEHRKKISEAKKGRTHKPISIEARQKIANSHKKKAVYCEETKQIFVSIQECARQMNIDATNICACCKGKHKICKGFHFRYYDDIQMPNDYPVREYTQASGNDSPLQTQGEDIV